MMFQLNEFGLAFSSRAKGAAVRDALLSARSDDSVVEIDFTDVRAVSQSFIDEFIGTLVERNATGSDPVPFTIVNVDPHLHRVVDAVQARRAALVA